jgi:hypothetical protein
MAHLTGGAHFMRGLNNKSNSLLFQQHKWVVSKQQQQLQQSCWRKLQILIASSSHTVLISILLSFFIFLLSQQFQLHKYWKPEWLLFNKNVSNSDVIHGQVYSTKIWEVAAMSSLKYAYTGIRLGTPKKTRRTSSIRISGRGLRYEPATFLTVVYTRIRERMNTNGDSSRSTAPHPTYIAHLPPSILWHMGRLYNNRGMSSLLSSDSVNILAATNAGNNSEYIVIIRY